MIFSFNKESARDQHASNVLSFDNSNSIKMPYFVVNDEKQDHNQQCVCDNEGKSSRIYDTLDDYTFDQYYIEKSSWLVRDRISSTDGRAQSKEDSLTDKQPLREKNRKNHVPHKEKPPQVVARRNARERRRVHAVNMAFVRLRKMIPIQNARGKRISKVKTLQNAIRYIRDLELILQEDNYEYSCINERNYHHCRYDDILNDFDLEKDF